MNRYFKHLKMTLPCNREQLLEGIRNGEQYTYQCFYGHHQKREDRVDHSCLSQWFPASFTLDNVYYTTAEHYMMAEKARLFDESLITDILQAPHPKDAKALGRCVQNFDCDIWNANAFDIVVRANIAKFSQNEELQEFLLSVKESVFVEAAPRDKVWGIGMARMCPEAKNPFKWKGENKLGFALTVARNEIIGAKL
jgi:ribA/ribD-fused uncharacterized protein